ncbi:hypothetical protein D3C87_1716450 [compost metagenome]
MVEQHFGLKGGKIVAPKDKGGEQHVYPQEPGDAGFNGDGPHFCETDIEGRTGLFHRHTLVKDTFKYKMAAFL